MSPDTPKGADHAARASHGVPQPGGVMISPPPLQGMIERTNARHAVKGRQPNRHGRTFAHPIHWPLFLDSQVMHHGSTSFQHKRPGALNVVVMHATAADPQPFTLARLHQMQRY